MRILITGGSGFIGFNLTKYLSNKYGKSVKIDILDNLSRKGSERNKKHIIKNKFAYNFFKFDCSNKRKLENTISKINYDIIFHLAAQVAVTSSIANPIKDFNDNLLSTINLLDIIRKKKSKPLFIYSSTNKVYGNLSYLNFKVSKKRIESDPKEIDEKFPLNFNTPYGCSKGSSDQYISDFSKTFNFPSVVLRLSCIYGTYQNGIEDQGWINWIIKNAMKKNDINIYGSGKQVRDILHVNDLCRLFDKIINSGKKITHEVYNIGGGYDNSISLLNLIDICKSNGFKFKCSFNQWRNDDQKYYVSNFTKAKNKFNWTPKISFNQGIDEMISWLSKLENKDYLNK